MVLLILGPKRLPGLGRSLGGGMREFKDSITRPRTSRPSCRRGADREPLDGEVVPEPRR